MTTNHLIRYPWPLGVTLIGAMLCVQPAAAQPAISSISGTFTHGTPIVLSGTGFGTKATPAPRVWETFADGLLSTLLADHGGMVYSNGDNLRHAYSGFNARADFAAAAENGDGYYFRYRGGAAPKWFVQYWVKPGANWQWGTGQYGEADMNVANVKLFRLYPIGDRNYSNAGYSLHGFDGGGVLRFVENGVETYLDVDGRSWFTPNVWHNVQVSFGENSGVDQPDGTMQLWVDGVLRDSTTTLITNASVDGPAIDKRPYIIGWFNSWPEAKVGTSMYAYFSDIYVDDTWARVELGNANTYAACTRREMQIPTVWSDSTVTIEANQGAFVTGQTTYLYVIDSNGQVNANGYPLVIGGGVPAKPLTAPTGLHIVK